MLIGLISDTHIPEAGPDLPEEVFEAFRGVDLILHAGDMHVIGVLDILERIAPVLAARGNGDHPVRLNPNRPGVPDDPRVKEAHIIMLEGFTLGLTHTFPTPGEVPWERVTGAIQRVFGQDVDIVVCGDTHVELVFQEEGPLLVNPGSPTLPHNRVEMLGTVALMELSRGLVPRAEIVHLKGLALR